MQCRGTARLPEAVRQLSNLPPRGRRARPRHARSPSPEPRHARRRPRSSRPVPAAFPRPLSPAGRGRRCGSRWSTAPSSSSSSRLLPLLLFLTPVPTRWAGERVRFAGTVQKWQLARWRCSGSRRKRCGDRGAAGRASHCAAHQPSWRRRRRPGSRLSAPSSLCASPGSARGAVGAIRRARAGVGLALGSRVFFSNL